jgi:hypothetical protein
LGYLILGISTSVCALFAAVLASAKAHHSLQGISQ